MCWQGTLSCLNLSYTVLRDIEGSVVRAWLGPKALALAWPKWGFGFSKLRAKPKPHCWPGPGLALAQARAFIR